MGMPVNVVSIIRPVGYVNIFLLFLLTLHRYCLALRDGHTAATARVSGWAFDLLAFVGLEELIERDLNTIER